MLQTLIKIQHLAEETSRQSVQRRVWIASPRKKVIAYPVVCCADRKAYRNIAQWQSRGISDLTRWFEPICPGWVAIPTYTIFSPQGIPAAVEMPFSMQVSESDTFYIAIFRTACTAPA